MKIIKLVLLSSVLLTSCNEDKKVRNKKKAIDHVTPKETESQENQTQEFVDTSKNIQPNLIKIKKRKTEPEKTKAQRRPTEEWKERDKEKREKRRLYNDSVRKANQVKDSLKP